MALRHVELGLGFPNDAEYWQLVMQAALRLGADGCSGVLDFHLDACLEHDVHYRTHKTVHGRPLTREDADKVFRERLQEFSWLDGLSPMAWWRWAGVRLFGKKAWDGKP